MDNGSGMVFEWDEAKRLSNVEKHGYDFSDAHSVFTGIHLVVPASIVEGEARLAAIGPLAAGHVTIIYTLRGSTIRLISMRRALWRTSRTRGATRQGSWQRKWQPVKA